MKNNLLEEIAVIEKHDPSELVLKRGHLSLIGENPCLSVLEKSVHYSFELVSFSGGHSFSCSLVFDSNMPYVVKEKMKGLSEGFKLSLSALMIEAKVHGEDGYIYIDGDGSCHSFARYLDKGEVLFHDTEGLGLVYDSAVQTILDDKGNAFKFDDEGRISESSRGGLFILRYTYDKSGYLTSVLDATGGKRKIEIGYVKGKVSYVRSMYGDEAITERKFSFTEKLVVGMMMPWQLQSVFGPSVTNSSEDELLLSIHYGAAGIREDPLVEGIDDLYSHSGFRITREGKTVKKLSMSPMDIKATFRERTFFEITDEGNSSFMMKNEKGQTITLMLDERGNIVSVFEKQGDGTLHSIEWEPGDLLVMTGTETSIDGLPYRTCSRGFPIVIDKVKKNDSENESLLSEVFVDKGTSIVAFVRLKESHPGVVLTATGCFSACLNPYAVNVWQKVSLGFDTDEMPQKISLSVINDIGIAVSADVSNVRIVRSPTDRLAIGEKFFAELHQLSKSGTRIRGIVSQNDFIKSFYNYVFSELPTVFLYMNDGKDMIPLDEVAFIDGDKTVLFSDVFENNSAIKYTFDHLSGACTEKTYTKKGKEMSCLKCIFKHDKSILSSEEDSGTPLDQFHLDKRKTLRGKHFSKDGLLRAESIDKKSIVEYGYDSDGNLVRETTEKGTIMRSYSKGRVISETDGLIDRTFSYDSMGRRESVSLGNAFENKISYQGEDVYSLSDDVTNVRFISNFSNNTLDYVLNGDLLEKTTYRASEIETAYGRESTIIVETDGLGKTISFKEKNGPESKIEYESIGNSSLSSRPVRITDGFSGIETTVLYDSRGNVRKTEARKNGKCWIFREKMMNGTDVEYVVGPGSFPYTRAVTSKERHGIIGYYRENNDVLRFAKTETFLDSLGRKIKREGSLLSYSYYYDGNLLAPKRIDADFFDYGIRYLNGGYRIEEISATGYENHTDKYEYDFVGRLLSVERTGVGHYTRRYQYNGSRLLSISNALALRRDKNGRVNSISDLVRSKRINLGYDSLGNVSSYGDMQLTYACGHRLTSVSVDGKTISYNYDASGTRIEKITDSGKTSFYYENGILLGEDMDNGTRIRFFTDDETYSGFTLEESGQSTHYYAYMRDPFGSVIGIVDEMGFVLGTYEYDEKGMLLGIHFNKNVSDSERILRMNPIRYRGYYYDDETGFYYLLSRYYDPVSMMFITPDDKDKLSSSSSGGIDPYCYCGYDPVNYVDPNGCVSVTGLLIAAGIGAVVGAASYATSVVVIAAFTGEWEWSFCEFIGSVIGGAVGTILVMFGAPAFVSGFVTGALTTASSMGLKNVYNYIVGDSINNYSWQQVLTSSVINGLFSGLASSMGSVVKVDGFNKGRNSLSSLEKTIFKKLNNKTIKHISGKTFGKLFTFEYESGWFGFITDLLLAETGEGDLLNEPW